MKSVSVIAVIPSIVANAMKWTSVPIAWKSCVARVPHSCPANSVALDCVRIVPCAVADVELCYVKEIASLQWNVIRVN